MFHINDGLCQIVREFCAVDCDEVLRQVFCSFTCTGPAYISTRVLLFSVV